MREERLLERIRMREKEPARRDSPDTRRIIDSIVKHIQRILNTKQGNVPIAEDYGIPDFLDFLQTYPDSVRDIERSIRLAIQKYEPRLQAVRVSYIPQEADVISLHFQITAKLWTESKAPVLLETIVDSSGEISIRG
jgi:type VI secretion system protein